LKRSDGRPRIYRGYDVTVKMSTGIGNRCEDIAQTRVRRKSYLHRTRTRVTQLRPYYIVYDVEFGNHTETNETSITAIAFIESTIASSQDGTTVQSVVR